MYCLEWGWCPNGGIGSLTGDWSVVAFCVGSCVREGPKEHDWHRGRDTENKGVREQLPNYESVALPLSYLGP